LCLSGQDSGARGELNDMYLRSHTWVARLPTWLVSTLPG